jgi:DNA-binding NarL/FixJ family response regulator
MSRLNFTKPEIAYIKSKIYLREDDERILDLWLVEKTNKEIAAEVKLAVSTVARRKDIILKKINKVL